MAINDHVAAEPDRGQIVPRRCSRPGFATGYLAVQSADADIAVVMFDPEEATHACAVGHFDLEHPTFQLEPAAHIGHESSAH